MNSLLTYKIKLFSYFHS
uniref:Uncharacterized protein n=1 Tax=Arundo donax TaxID=35708 RepID=A0A0A9HXL3_ARUDO